MATAREHIAAYHRQASKHHGDVAKCHSNLAKHFASLHKETGVRGESTHIQISSEHERLSELHKAHSEFHEQQAEACVKAASDSDLNKRGGIQEIVQDEVRKALDSLIAPSRVSGVVPDNPHLRSVPRTGQREINAEKDPVPLELEKVLALD